MINRATEDDDDEPMPENWVEVALTDHTGKRTTQRGGLDSLGHEVYWAVRNHLGDERLTLLALAEAVVVQFEMGDCEVFGASALPDGTPENAFADVARAVLEKFGRD